MPGDPENRDKSYKYPFVASNVLNSSSDICKYLLEGGMPQEEAEPEEDEAPTQETLNKDSDSEEATATDAKITETKDETPESGA